MGQNEMMNAVKFVEKDVMEVVKKPIPEIAEDEVLIELKASGLCTADLKLWHAVSVLGDSGSVSPFTPGHESCGVVSKIGDRVANVKVGDRIVVYMMYGCEKCEYCNMGYTMLCRDFNCMGFGRDGGHADYVAIPAINCLPIPDEMSYIRAAVTIDVGGTLYSSCKALQLNGRDTLAIFGAGPMGCGGVMLAKAFGARVIAVDLSDDRLEFARKCGADFTVNPAKTDLMEELARITNGKMCDAAIDCTGNEKAERSAFECIRPFGRVNIVGENTSCTIDPSNHFLRKMCTATASWIYPKTGWVEIINFIMEKDIPLEMLATHTFDITAAQKAYEMYEAQQTQKALFIWD